jgi:hypothetical protein
MAPEVVMYGQYTRKSDVRIFFRNFQKFFPFSEIFHILLNCFFFQISFRNSDDYFFQRTFRTSDYYFFKLRFGLQIFFLSFQVYSFGVILWEMITLKDPYAGE